MGVRAGIQIYDWTKHNSEVRWGMEVGRARMAIGRGAKGRRFWRSRTVWLGFFALATFMFVACTSGSAATDPVPDFELALFENENHTRGEVLRLSDLRGSPVVLNFWYPSCPPCRAEMPDLEKAFQKYKDKGVEFIGVEELILDTVEDGQEFVSEIGVSYALGPDEDGDLIAAYNITGFPTTFFLDENHNIVRKWTGILNAEKIEELIEELLD